jgi:hypothetical protein
MTMPAEITEYMYDKSTWNKSFTFMENYVDPSNPGTPLDLLQYEIKWEGKLREFAKDTYFSYEKATGEAGTEGIIVSGGDNNVLNLALDTETTTLFKGKIIISDLKFILNDDVKYNLRITFDNQEGVTE